MTGCCWAEAIRADVEAGRATPPADCLVESTDGVPIRVAEREGTTIRGVELRTGEHVLAVVGYDGRADVTVWLGAAETARLRRDLADRLRGGR